ncbi:hypothetical protein EON63_05735 [archaeon]|nr:MAG: hypothetical protein EON63_05735 [archaeon]
MAYSYYDTCTVYSEHKYKCYIPLMCLRLSCGSRGRCISMAASTSASLSLCMCVCVYMVN